MIIMTIPLTIISDNQQVQKRISTKEHVYAHE